jgi:chromosome segregation ATPase
MKKVIVLLLLISSLFSCNQDEKLLTDQNLALTARLDSLSIELESTQKSANTLVQAMGLMDSITIGRQALRLTLEGSDSEQDFLDLMKELNNYLDQTAKQISLLEKSLKQSKSAQNSYAASLTTLKTAFQQQKAEIGILESRLENEKSNNSKLIALNNMQSETILDQDEKIAAKTLELELLDQQIAELKSTFKVSEADSYYTQGEAYLLAAQRTKLAPNKKKATYKLAVDAYQNALMLGKEEAKEKLELISKKLH